MESFAIMILWAIAGILMWCIAGLVFGSNPVQRVVRYYETEASGTLKIVTVVVIFVLIKVLEVLYV